MKLKKIENLFINLLLGGLEIEFSKLPDKKDINNADLALKTVRSIIKNVKIK